MKSNRIVAKPKKALKNSVITTEISFLMIPADDRQLVRKFGLGLQDYWLDCWEADRYGSRYVLMPESDLRNTTQAKYRKQLEALGLFTFEVRKSGSDRSLWVLNLHGIRIKNYWQPIAQTLDQIEQNGDGIERNLDGITLYSDEFGKNNSENQVQQDFQDASVSSQEYSVTPQGVTEENIDNQPSLDEPLVDDEIPKGLIACRNRIQQLKQSKKSPWL